MLHSRQRHDAPLAAQVAFWNRWNADNRETRLSAVSEEQAAVVLSWLQQLGRTDWDIVEIGCGAGWLCGELVSFGRVTGMDLADQVLERAARRVPSARFVAGDFMASDFPPASFDVAVSLEVLSHVRDQSAFLEKVANTLRDGGYLMLATQNRPALEKNDIPPPAEGQIRQWVDRHELRVLLERQFEVVELFSITPQFNSGWRRCLTSRKLRAVAAALGLDVLNRLVKERQEETWRGWTLMALARKRGIMTPRG